MSTSSDRMGVNTTSVDEEKVEARSIRLQRRAIEPYGLRRRLSVLSTRMRSRPQGVGRPA